MRNIPSRIVAGSAFVNYINYQITHHYVQDDGSISIDDYLALTASLIMPYVTLLTKPVLVRDSAWKTVNPIVSLLPKDDDELCKYTQKSLELYLKENWVPTLSTESKRAVIECNHAFAIDGEKIQINQAIAARLHAMRTPDSPVINDCYGNENYGYYADEADEPTAVEAAQTDITAVEPNEAPTAQNYQRKRGNNRNKNFSENDKWAADRLRRLFDSLTSNKEWRKDCTFAWQWKLTIDEYESIRTTIREQAGKATIGNVVRINRNAAIVWGLYVAEFYKRQYNGNAGNNAFVEIGYDNNSAEIANAIDSVRVYEGENNKTPLNSLYVWGGIPINWYYQRNAANTSMSSMIELSHKASQFDLEDGVEYMSDKLESLVDQQTCSACRGSLNDMNGSLRNYVLYILKNKDIPFADGDEKIESMTWLRRQVQEGYQKSEREKFDFHFNVWTYFDDEKNEPKEFFLTPVIRLRKGLSDEKTMLPTRLLNSWNIQCENISFCLKLQNNNGYEVYDNYGRPVSIPFLRCMDGSYHEAYGRDQLELKTIEGSHLQKEDLTLSNMEFVYEGRTLNGIFSSAFSKGYFQLYSDDENDWKPFRGAQYKRYSAVLYDGSKWKSDGNPIYLNDNLLWCEFTDTMTLTSRTGQSNKTFYNSKGKLYVELADGCIHSLASSFAVISENNGKFEFIQSLSAERPSNDGDVEKNTSVLVSLIKSTHLSFVAKRIYQEIGEITEIDSKDLIVKCRLEDQESFKKYDPDEELPQGYVEFRIEHNNSQSELKCFVLSNDANIRAITNQPNRMEFNNIANVKSLEANDRFLNNRYTDRFDETVPFNDIPDALHFAVCSATGQLLISTIRPLCLSRQYLDGSKMDNRNVPVRFKSRCSVIEFNEEGCHKYFPDKENDRGLDAYLFDHLFHSKYHELNEQVYGRFHGMSFIPYNMRVGGDYLLPQAVNENNMNEYQFISIDFSTMEWQEVQKEACVSGGQPRVRLKDPKPGTTIFQVYDKSSSASYFMQPKHVLNENEHYYAENVLQNMRTENLNRYARNRKYLTENCYKSFEFATCHGVYYGSMDFLICMFIIVNRTDSPGNRLAQFAVGYNNYCCKNNKEPDYDSLWKLAKAFVFDWLFIPWSANIHDGDKEFVKKLLSSRPGVLPEDKYAHSIISEKYFEINFPKRIPNGIGEFLNYMRNPNPFCRLGTNDRKCFLQSFDDKEGKYDLILNSITFNN